MNIAKTLHCTSLLRCATKTHSCDSCADGVSEDDLGRVAVTVSARSCQRPETYDHANAVSTERSAVGGIQ